MSKLIPEDKKRLLSEGFFNSYIASGLFLNDKIIPESATKNSNDNPAQSFDASNETIPEFSLMKNDDGQHSSITIGSTEDLKADHRINSQLKQSDSSIVLMDDQPLLNKALPKTGSKSSMVVIAFGIFTGLIGIGTMLKRYE